MNTLSRSASGPAVTARIRASVGIGRILKTAFAMAMVSASLTGHSIAQIETLPTSHRPCLPDEPDSVQVSWNEPCEVGTWLFDTESGCRMWDWHPDTHDTVTWTSSCPLGLRDGKGVAQWFEHGEAIDRFEGIYRQGRREGFGHYSWNKTDYFRGNYEQDHPHGWGAAHIAGEDFVGQWQNGCLKVGDKVVAISVPRSSCVNSDTIAMEKSE